MTGAKMLTGVAIAASLLSYAPMAEAAPIIAAPSAVTLSNADGQIVQNLTPVVVVRRRAVVRAPVRRRVVR